jgi:hypothetical protein
MGQLMAQAQVFKNEWWRIFQNMERMKSRFNYTASFAFALCLCAGSSLLGCRGTTSGGEQDFGGGVAVSNADNTGRIEVSVNQSSVAVGGTAGFSAFAFDRNGRPVQGIRISCDSEKEIAIIEPTDGVETTGTFGGISGIIGCRRPGSYQFGCRLPIGANLRKFVDVKCVGDVPAGFDGFPGAAGGGLGGGTLPPASGGPGSGGSGNLRITAVSAETVTQTSATQIDTRQDVCNNNTPADPTDDFAELFGDDFVNITVTNGTSSLIRFTRMNYTVDNGRTDGGDARSPDISLTGEIQAAAGSTVTVRSLFLDSVSGTKTYGDGSTQVPTNLGFRNVTFRLYGTDDQGNEVVIETSTALSFDDFDNCNSSGG